MAAELVLAAPNCKRAVKKVYGEDERTSLSYVDDGLVDAVGLSPSNVMSPSLAVYRGLVRFDRMASDCCEYLLDLLSFVEADEPLSSLARLGRQPWDLDFRYEIVWTDTETTARAVVLIVPHDQLHPLGLWWSPKTQEWLKLAGEWLGWRVMTRM